MKSLTRWGGQKTVPTGNGNRLAPFESTPSPLARLRDEFDRLFQGFFRDFPALAAFDAEDRRWGLEVEDEDEFVRVRAEAPGFAAGDFDIRVDDGRLTIRAAKKTETKAEKGRPQEVREQECYEVVALPAGIDKDKVEAKYQSGVLTVTLPKTAAGRAKRVAVAAG